MALVQARGPDLRGIGLVLGTEVEEVEEVCIVVVVVAVAFVGVALLVLVAVPVVHGSACRLPSAVLLLVFSGCCGCCCCCCLRRASVAAHLTREAPSMPRSRRLSCSCRLLFTAVFTRFDGVILDGFSPVSAYRQLALLLLALPLSTLLLTPPLSSDGVKIPGLGTLVTFVTSFLPRVGPFAVCVVAVAAATVEAVGFGAAVSLAAFGWATGVAFLLSVVDVDVVGVVVV